MDRRRLFAGRDRVEEHDRAAAWGDGQAGVRGGRNRPLSPEDGDIHGQGVSPGVGYDEPLPPSGVAGSGEQPMRVARHLAGRGDQGAVVRISTQPGLHRGKARCQPLAATHLGTDVAGEAARDRPTTLADRSEHGSLGKRPCEELSAGRIDQIAQNRRGGAHGRHRRRATWNSGHAGQPLGLRSGTDQGGGAHRDAHGRTGDRGDNRRTEVQPTSGHRPREDDARPRRAENGGPERTSPGECHRSLRDRRLPKGTARKVAIPRSAN